MKRDQTDYAIGLLVLWWRREQINELLSHGYPPVCPSTAGWLASRQWDADNGAFETDERGSLAAEVGRIVSEMAEPYKSALYVLARNRATGLTVWRSPRLPEDETKRAEIVGEALAMFERMV